MTTIAYKDGVIAYDSRLNCDERIISDSFSKMVERNGVRFFCCGSQDHMERLADAYFGEDTGELEATALVVEGGKVYRVGRCEKRLYRSLMVEHGAIGSGTDHALTAMDMGATAAQAVKMAMKRDPFTGGRIRIFRVGA